MMMSKHFTSLLFFSLCLSLVCCEMPFASETNNDEKVNNAQAHQQNTLLTDIDELHADNDLEPGNYDKRVERYAFGLGRRAYTYTNGGGGIKRLPVYNFGLGKRARPYSFGLGKRAEYDDEPQYDVELDPRALTFFDNKRNRPYSFGLGKRDSAAVDDDRRGYPNRYGFGLGRR